MLMLWVYLEMAARAARRRRRPASVVVTKQDTRRRCACTRCAADRAFRRVA